MRSSDQFHVLSGIVLMEWIVVWAQLSGYPHRIPDVSYIWTRHFAHFVLCSGMVTKTKNEGNKCGYLSIWWKTWNTAAWLIEQDSRPVRQNFCSDGNILYLSCPCDYVSITATSIPKLRPFQFHASPPGLCLYSQQEL